MICDKFIDIVERINQEEELLIVLRRQCFDVLLEISQVLDHLIHDFLFRNFLLEKLWFFTVMKFLFFQHPFEMEIKLQIHFLLNHLIFCFGWDWLGIRLWGLNHVLHLRFLRTIRFVSIRLRLHWLFDTFWLKNGLYE